IFGLQSGNGMNLRRTPKSLRTRFRQAQVTDFAFLHQLRHRAYSLLDWSAVIDAVLIIKIDCLDAQPLQAGLARLADIVWFATDPADVGIFLVANNPEFGGQYNLVATSANSLADELFVDERSVNVGGVQ